MEMRVNNIEFVAILIRCYFKDIVIFNPILSCHFGSFSLGQYRPCTL